MDAEPNKAAWRKSRRSANNGGDRVEVAVTWRKAIRGADNGGAWVEVAISERRAALPAA